MPVATGFFIVTRRLARKADGTCGSPAELRPDDSDQLQLTADANAFAERVIGSIRRKCIDHIIPVGRRHLLSTIREHTAYYNASRPHQSLDRNSPVPREVESEGEIVAMPVLGGLHHRYGRTAA